MQDRPLGNQGGVYGEDIGGEAECIRSRADGSGVFITLVPLPLASASRPHVTSTHHGVSCWCDETSGTRSDHRVHCVLDAVSPFIASCRTSLRSTLIISLRLRTRALFVGHEKDAVPAEKRGGGAKKEDCRD